MRSESPSESNNIEAPASSARSGVLSGRQIGALVESGAIFSDAPLAEGQIQPASLDLRLGPKAYRVRASFLPGESRTVSELLSALKYDEMSLAAAGAVLERGCFYVVPLQESLALAETMSGAANPKSSTGRLDIFTRLITDYGERFDLVAAGYKGPLYAEVSPRSFSVRVRAGSRLNQLRFRLHDSSEPRQTNFILTDAALGALHQRTPLVDGLLNLRDGVVLRVALDGGRFGADAPGQVVGYRAQKHADVIDVDRLRAYAIDDYWDRLRVRAEKRLILDPGDFYILASKERLRIPANLAAEMAPMDAAIGEFRVHYAGFFDPGFGAGLDGEPCARAVLEVRSREVPFILEDGQFIGRLVYERMAEAPATLYGELGVSNYQGQDLTLSKHFKAP